MCSKSVETDAVFFKIEMNYEGNVILVQNTAFSILIFLRGLVANLLDYDAVIKRFRIPMAQLCYSQERQKSPYPQNYRLNSTIK